MAKVKPIRPIDAIQLHRKIMDDAEYDFSKELSLAQCLLYVENAPTIKAKPIRCGQWIHIRTAGVISLWKCSECDSTITANFAIKNPANHDKFCYNCGAKMNGGIENGIN